MKLDPRTKLVFVCILTSLAVIKVNIIHLVITTLMTLVIAGVVKYDTIKSMIKMKKLLSSFVIIGILQCLFTNTGDPLICIGDYTLVTQDGVNMGTQFILRMFIIILCAGILSTSNSREIIQGLIQLKIPYEFAFMVTIAMSFIPVMSQEIQDTVIALNLRGVNLKKISIKKKVETFTYLFFPIIMNSLEKSKELAISLELRGFRQKKNRTSRVHLELYPKDIVMMTVSLVLFCIMLMN